MWCSIKHSEDTKDNNNCLKNYFPGYKYCWKLYNTFFCLVQIKLKMSVFLKRFSQYHFMKLTSGFLPCSVPVEKPPYFLKAFWRKLWSPRRSGMSMAEETTTARPYDKTPLIQLIVLMWQSQKFLSQKLEKKILKIRMEWLDRIDSL